MISRQDIIASARDWLGTPFHHQASEKHTGCDCLGLLRGVWFDLYGHSVSTALVYDVSWMRHGKDLLLEALQESLLRVRSTEILPGHVLLFRWRPYWAASHLAIATSPDTIIHAQDGCGVCEVSLPISWRNVIAARFEFPDLRE